MAIGLVILAIIIPILLLTLLHIVIEHGVHLSPGALTRLDTRKARRTLRIIVWRCNAVG